MSAYEDYDGATCWADCSADDIREATESGLLCAECGTEFVKSHGVKVACSFCFRRLTVAEISAAGLRLATHEESNKAAHANEARKRRRSV